MTSIEIVNTYGQPHRTSEKNPNHVIGADRYRLPLTGFIVAGAPGFDDMVKWLADCEDEQGKSLHTRPEGYGLIFLESEEHAATYFGPIEQVQRYRDENVDGTATFDQSEGVTVGGWPQGKGWDEFLPRVFWNQGGVGIVTAFAHNAIPGAEVIVYEYEGTWGMGDKSEPRPMVTYHCTGCHKDTLHDSGHMHENKGPHDRRWMARKAREHITGAVRHGLRNENSLCRPGSSVEMLRVVNEVAASQLGPGYLPHPEDEGGYCAVKGPCSILRDMRAGVRPAPYGR